VRVLVAEDNLVNQKVHSRILARLGIKNCTVVDNGEKAVEREANEPFDVVFMDMQMPVMNGTEATNRICSRSEEGSHPRAPVIFVTAHVADRFEEQCRNSGAVGFLSKPCTFDSVEQCLRSVVGHDCKSSH
jgi:CheY-like chemotaxis protein